MAGLDGIANKIDPGGPQDRDLYELPDDEIQQALMALENFPKPPCK